MSDVTETVNTYLTLLNETDADRRAALVGQVWAGDGRWVDPPVEAAGHAGIADMVGAIHAQFPGHTFRRVSGVDVHHDAVRFAWELVGPDGAVAFGGLDVGVLADD